MGSGIKRTGMVMKDWQNRYAVMSLVLQTFRIMFLMKPAGSVETPPHIRSAAGRAAH